MSRSFRVQLALRFTLVLAGGLTAVSLAGFLALRDTLDRQINSTLLNVASFQAASVTEAPFGGMAFHEWDLTVEEAASIRDLNRFTQVWDEGGESLLRTRYITEDLPLDADALRTAAAGDIVWRQQTFQSMPIRSLYYPLGRLGDEHEAHVLQVAAPLEARNRMLGRVALFLASVVVLASLGAYGGGWWLASHAIRPVAAIIDQAEAIEPGSERHRIRAYANTREYQRLVEVLNRMLARLNDAFESQRRFTADASHELRSPLTALRGELELARRRDRSPEEYRRVLGSALEEVERLCRVAEDLLTLARSDAGVMEPRLRRVDLAECAARTLERLRTKASAKEIDLRLDVTGPVPGLFDPDLLDRLVWNLVENAIKFTPSGGVVAIGVHANGGEALIEVIDTGPGIPSEKLERMFERFYRGDFVRTPSLENTGTGLGLSIANAIAEVHGGTLAASNREGGGAVLRVTLPRRIEATAGQGARELAHTV
jgi:two-component system, OmpR family, sensor kinase